MLIFAFGSNLDPAQMRKRCPRSQLVRRATYHNHRLVFRGYSLGWRGAVAALEPAPGRRVLGAVYQVDSLDLRRLDSFEGHPHVYRRRPARVRLDSGVACHAEVYNLLGRPHGWPSEAYIAAIVRGYQALRYETQALADALVWSVDQADRSYDELVAQAESELTGQLNLFASKDSAWRIAVND